MRHMYFHPLAGLGVNLGIQDIASLNEVINQCIEKGTEINDTKTFATFRKVAVNQKQLN